MIAAAEQQVLLPAETTLVSDADRMISLRHTERMWQTPDGALHILINQGTLGGANSSLQLHSSFDGGKTWLAMHGLADTDKFSTADGILIDDKLGIAYAARNGRILYSVLRYGSFARTWTLLKTETVVAASGATAINPAIAVDDLGNLWCAFVNKVDSTLETNIKLFQRTQDGAVWQDTGLIFGSTDIDSGFGERSARPVITANGVGMIYTLRENIHWAYRQNGWPVTAPWVEQVIFTSAPPYDTDPYNSHFSVVTDGNRNIHMATVDHGKLLYQRYITRTQSWSSARELTNDISAGYPQITITQNGLAIFVNAATYPVALQSVNAGNTFEGTAFMTHESPPPGSAINYGNPRIESPGRVAGQVPVLQQYVEGGVQKLLLFRVPLIAGQ
jgi:hypothetical protein